MGPGKMGIWYDREVLLNIEFNAAKEEKLPSTD